MKVPQELLLFATVAGVAASTALTAFGLRRARFPGWWWWVAASWLTTLGLLLAAAAPAAWGPALATPLLLQAPLVTLMGLRRFHARQRWPGNLRTDAVLLAVATLAAAAAEGALQDAAIWPVLACGLALQLYAAAVMFTGPGGREATPVLALAATTALLAFAPGLLVLVNELSAASPAQQTAAALLGRALAAALGAIVGAFVALTLVFGRTERQLRESRRRLRLLANLDALTQVPNRRHFNELAGRAMRADPPGSAVLLLMGIDHFKQVNEQFGRPAGDRALCLVAGSVLEHLRTHDTAGRHAGDEFVLLLRRATMQDAMGVAARVAAEVQRRAEPTPLPPLSLSFGMVQLRAGEEVDAALRRADQALFEAKRQGRSRAVAALGDEDCQLFSVSRPLGLVPG